VRVAPVATVIVVNGEYTLHRADVPSASEAPYGIVVLNPVTRLPTPQIGRWYTIFLYPARATCVDVMIPDEIVPIFEKLRFTSTIGVPPRIIDPTFANSEQVTLVVETILPTTYKLAVGVDVPIPAIPLTTNEFAGAATPVRP
jgi:hypothetical protein